MADRRMTSLEVVNTDAFLDMPPSTQNLYFHLNARADDDGFVSNPKGIMRNVGGGADDFKVLIGKKFLISFEDGVVVIKHWRINNYIRKDIYKETKYLDHKKTLYIRSNGAYTLNGDNRAVLLPEGHFQLEDVHEALTTRAPRLGKVSIDKNIRETNVSLTPDIKDSDITYEPMDEMAVPKPKEPSKLKKYNELMAGLEKRRNDILADGFRFLGDRRRHYKRLKELAGAKLPYEAIYIKWEEMCRNSFWQERGFGLEELIRELEKKPI